MTLDELKEYFDERLHDMETRLLSEFRKWAIPIEGSRRIQHATNSSTEDRLTALEDRMKELEKKGGE